MTFKAGDQVFYIGPELLDVDCKKVYTLTNVINRADSEQEVQFLDNTNWLRYRCATEVRLHKTAAQVAAEVAAAERKPWEVLREAALILTADDMRVSAYQAEQLASRLEAEANVPDPIEVLRRLDAFLISFYCDEGNVGERYRGIWRDAKRVLAAHAKQKKEV